MWAWTLNWGEVTSRILVGTCPMKPQDLARIAREAKVQAVLSLQHDDCLGYWNVDYAQMQRAGERLELAMSRCPIRDFDIADMRLRLPAAVTALAVQQRAGYRTYVHCTAGLGRGPLTVLAYLVLMKGYSSEAAIRLINAARPGAVPAWEAFHGCCEDLEGRYHSDIEQRAYELHQQGIHTDACTDWQQARAEVLRLALARPARGVGVD